MQSCKAFRQNIRKNFFITKNQVILAFFAFSSHLCNMTEEIDTFKPFSFWTIIEEAMSEQFGFFQRIRAVFDITIIAEPIRYNKKKICRATGMSYSELNHFLTKRGFNSDGKFIEHEAMDALEKWYLKKLKRYLRNGISSEGGSKEKVVFADFCRKYKKTNRKTVKSWKDIDEDSVLSDFRDECEGIAPSEQYCDGKQTLFAAIYASYLFHTRCRVTKHTTLSESIISFIISHRYHIFITEGDSNADENIVFRNLLFNPPRSAMVYGLASRQNS